MSVSRRLKLRRPSRAVAAVGAGILMFSTAACGAETSASDPATGSDDPIRIGVLAPLSGALAPYGEDLSRGVEVGATLINEDGGILGRQVEVIVEDDQTDPAAAAERARKLLEQDEVDVLMGTISSATTLAVIPLAEEAGVPYIYVVEGEAKTCTPENTARQYIFGHGATPEQKFAGFVPYMVENFGDAVYFVGSDYVFPQFVAEILAGELEPLDAELVGEDYAPLGTSDFATIITRIDSESPDVVFSSVVGTDGVAFIQQFREFGLHERMEITGIPSFDAAVFEGIRDIAQGAFVPERYTSELDNAINDRFVEAYRDQWDAEGPISDTAAQGAYGTMLMFKAAIEEAGTTEGEAVAEALVGLTVDTPAGEVTVNPENHIVTSNMYLLQIEDDAYTVVEDLGRVEHPGFSGCSAEG